MFFLRGWGLQWGEKSLILLSGFCVSLLACGLHSAVDHLLKLGCTKFSWSDVTHNPGPCCSLVWGSLIIAATSLRNWGLLVAVLRRLRDIVRDRSWECEVRTLHVHVEKLFLCQPQGLLL